MTVRSARIFLAAMLVAAWAAACGSSSTPTPTVGAVEATAGDKQVIITWTVAEGATGYRIFWANQSGVTTSSENFIDILPAAYKYTEDGSLTYTHTGLTNGTRYFYAVAMLMADSISRLSQEVDAKPVIPAPDAPTGVAASGANTVVNLSWKKNSRADYYRIYGKTGSGGITDADTIIADNVTTNSYQHSGLANGTAYYYRVSAINSTGESPLSAEVSATPSEIVDPSNCTTVPQHSGNVVWTRSDCGPYTFGRSERYQFPMDGIPDAKNGKLSFTIKGIDNKYFTSFWHFVPVMVKFGLNANEGGRLIGNFFLPISFYSGQHHTDLLSQRWNTACGKFCESQNRYTGVNWNGARTYQLDFDWGGSQAHLIITDLTTQQQVANLRVNTNGEFKTLTYARVGPNALDGYPGFNAPVVVGNLRLSILQ